MVIAITLMFVIVAALLALGAWALDLFRATDEAELSRRAEYQRLIRHLVGMMCDHSDAEILEDLEWLLHSALYEYRNA